MPKRVDIESETATYKLGLAWLGFIKTMEGLEDQGLRVTRVSLKGEWFDGGSILVVLTAEGPDGPMVAFHNADDLDGLWKGLRNRIRNGNLKWKVDEYASK